jgi:uncharacterized membrane protein YczE
VLTLLARMVAVALGLVPFALGVVLTLQSGLGLGPWLVLSQGLARVLPLTFGLATILVGVVVVLLGMALGIRPALATLMNMTLVGLYADGILASGLVPDLGPAGWSPPVVAARLGLLVGGVILVGMGTALYLKVGLGAGPRDGLMLGLSRRLRRPIAPVRTGIEVTVLVLGVLLGGTAGLGTLIFALGVGPAVAAWFRVFGVQAPGAHRVTPAAEVAAEPPV